MILDEFGSMWQCFEGANTGTELEGLTAARRHQTEVILGRSVRQRLRLMTHKAQEANDAICFGLLRQNPG